MVIGFSRKNLPDTVLLIFHNEICFTTFLNKVGGLNTILADGNGAAFFEPPKFQPALDQPDFPFSAVFKPPRRISSCRHQTNHSGAAKADS